MKLPKRFALSTLLVLVLIVASVFGFAQWRRQGLVAEVAQLQQRDVSGLVLSDGWFWPTVSRSASIIVTHYDEARVQEIMRRLQTIGVADVTYILLDSRGKPIEWRLVEDASDDS